MPLPLPVCPERCRLLPALPRAGVRLSVWSENRKSESRQSASGAGRTRPGAERLPPSQRQSLVKPKLLMLCQPKFPVTHQVLSSRWPSGKIHRLQPPTAHFAYGTRTTSLTHVVLSSWPAEKLFRPCPEPLKLVSHGLWGPNVYDLKMPGISAAAFHLNMLPCRGSESASLHGS